MFSIKLKLFFLVLCLINENKAQTTVSRTTTTIRTNGSIFITTPPSPPVTSSTRTTTTSASTTTNPGASNIKDFNSTSNVVYWEKCGLEARTRLTRIFQSSGSLNQHQLLYNPFSNSLVYRIVQVNQNLTLSEQTFDLDFNIDGKTVFFLFDELDTISVYFGCPNSLSDSYSFNINAPGITSVRSLELNQDSWLFASLRDVMATFGCKLRQTVQVGTLIYFPSVQSSLENLQLISFNLNDTTYSLTLNRDGNIYLNASFFSKLNTKSLRTNSDIYFYFKNNSIELYDTCVVDSTKSLGVWFIKIDPKMIIETSLDYRIGNGAAKPLLDSFCSIQRISRSQILDDAIKLYETYLPTNNIIQQVEQFKSFLTVNGFSIDQLVENEPKILIASRRNPQPEFFNRGIQDYIKGFSDGQDNLWIGLDLLNKVTQLNNYILRIEAQTEYGILSEEYSYFRVGNRSSRFRIEIDDLKFREGQTFNSISGNTFSTFDYGDNRYLASEFMGGFWFSANQSITNVTCLTCLSENNTLFVSLDGSDNARVSSLKLYLKPQANPISFKIENLFDSRIVDDPRKLLDLIEFNGLQPENFKLIYRASRDGFSANSFHARSKNKQNVLAIIRSGANIFGGYTQYSWNGNSYGNYRSDSSAFLYSYSNPNQTSALFRPYSYYTYYSTYDSSYNLMQFGSGSDLAICSNANTNMCSYSYLGNTYQSSNYYTSTYGYYNYYGTISTFFTGSNYFYVDEIELYQRLN